MLAVRAHETLSIFGSVFCRTGSGMLSLGDRELFGEQSSPAVDLFSSSS